MRRLDGLSTYILLCEDPAAYQHTLKIGIFDTSQVPGGWNYANFRKSLAGGIDVLPLFRCKVVHVPLGIHRPVWVEDHDFDIDNHLRYVSCPPPGDNRALCALISQIYAYPLDRSRPLWQTWVIDGLADGQIAIVTLLHHAYTDGSGAARLMSRFFTTEPSSALPEAHEWHAERMPSKLALVLGALWDLPGSLITGLPRVLRGRREMRRVQEQYEREGRAPAPNPFKDSRDSPFNVLLSRGRTFVFETVPLSQISDTAKSFGVTINDLFLAAAAEVYRQLMVERGYDADKGPLVTAIPMSMRPPLSQDDMVGNKTSSDYLWLPVHLADPLERLRFAHQQSEEMKVHFKAIEGADSLSLMEVLPLPALVLPDWYVKHRKVAIGWTGNVCLSNVKGPEKPLYWGDMRMTNWLSTGQVVQGVAINTTVWSYAGNFNICVMADKKLLPDGWEAMARYRESFERYAALASEGKTLNPAN